MGKSLIQQKRGKGSPTYTTPAHRFPGVARIPDDGSGVIIDFIDSKVHTAALSVIRHDNGSLYLTIAPEQLRVGQTLSFGAGAPLAIGNALPLAEIPEGTLIHNIEAMPGDGGSFTRASGASARVFAKYGNKVIVQFASKKRKTLNPQCRAQIGVASGGGRTEKPLMKAGNAYWKNKAKNRRWPIIGGTSQNAVSHPFGNKRSLRKSKARPAPKNAPPGRNVGMIHPRRTGRKRGGNTVVQKQEK
jgi:large subunit ribosomal protein L2